MKNSALHAVMVSTPTGLRTTITGDPRRAAEVAERMRERLNDGDTLAVRLYLPPRATPDQIEAALEKQRAALVRRAAFEICPPVSVCSRQSKLALALVAWRRFMAPIVPKVERLVAAVQKVAAWRRERPHRQRHREARWIAAIDQPGARRKPTRFVGSTRQEAELIG